MTFLPSFVRTNYVDNRSQHSDGYKNARPHIRKHTQLPIPVKGRESIYPFVLKSKSHEEQTTIYRITDPEERESPSFTHHILTPVYPLSHLHAHVPPASHLPPPPPPFLFTPTHTRSSHVPPTSLPPLSHLPSPSFPSTQSLEARCSSHQASLCTKG